MEARVYNRWRFGIMERELHKKYKDSWEFRAFVTANSNIPQR